MSDTVLKFSTTLFVVQEKDELRMEWDGGLSRACAELGEVLNRRTVCIQLLVQELLAEKKKKTLNVYFLTSNKESANSY